MKRRGLFVQILVPFLALLIAALAATTWEAFRFLERFHRAEVSAELESAARVFAGELAGLLEDSARADARCKALGALAEKRVTVILPDGRVIGDSDENPANMDSHADRPEVRMALAGNAGQSIRFSHTLHTGFMYVAVPVPVSGKVAGVVRVSRSLASVDRALREVYGRIGVAATIVGMLGAVVSLIAARRITRPLQRMKTGAERFAQGDLSGRLTAPRSLELADLAAAMNHMAGELNDRIQLVHRQRDELQAVLASMNEGVVAVDGAARIISVNRAAAVLFGVDPEAAVGRPVEEVIRSPKLQRGVARTLAHAETVEEEVVLGGTEERTLRVATTVLQDEGERPVGALMVMEDVTQRYRFERARSEFVANVSHEIRTPVTSIKGYAETLLNDPPEEPETTARFLAIIARQAGRLCSLVEDILALASLERSEMAADVAFEQTALCGVLKAAMNTCAPKAAEKGVQISISGGDSITVRANAPLLEQAVINLLENAIKYSHAGGAIEIEAGPGVGGVAISIRDYGTGIAPEHLARIFERFYRVDRARSRQLGGTGLGLAIVKHIALLHGGQIRVESTEGKGSCFTLQLPPA